MTEPTITCPNCKTEIKLTESLAAPLIEATRKQYEDQLAQKDSDIAAREKAAREKEKELAEAKTKLDEQVADQVAAQLKKDRASIAAEESKKAKLAAATDLEEKARELSELQEALDKNNAKLAKAQQAEAELIRKQRELDDAKRELELTVETRVLSRRKACHQRVLAGCAARRTSAGLAVANSNECNAAARPPKLAQREPSQGTNAALRPSPRARHWLRNAPCLDSLGWL